jgi:hypothetical protein
LIPRHKSPFRRHSALGEVFNTDAGFSDLKMALH